MTWISLFILGPFCIDHLYFTTQITKKYIVQPCTSSALPTRSPRPWLSAREGRLVARKKGAKYCNGSTPGTWIEEFKSFGTSWNWQNLFASSKTGEHCLHFEVLYFCTKIWFHPARKNQEIHLLTTKPKKQVSSITKSAQTPFLEIHCTNTHQTRKRLKIYTCCSVPHSSIIFSHQLHQELNSETTLRCQVHSGNQGPTFISLYFELYFSSVCWFDFTIISFILFCSKYASSSKIYIALPFDLFHKSLHLDSVRNLHF